MEDNRIQELEEWSAETGLPLPMSAEEICVLEDMGHIVDLETGDVSLDPDAVTAAPDGLYEQPSS